MYKKILIPLDGSATAESVLPYARVCAQKLNASIELLTIVDVMDMARAASAADGLYLDRILEEETRRMSDYLTKIAKSLAGLAVEPRLEKGNAAEVIIETAAADKGALVMMATHGRSGLNRFLLGSVAEKVLRGTLNPLLLVRASAPTQINEEAALKTIVVPLDGSELAEAVLPAVEELAKKLDLEIVLLRIYAVPYGAYTAGEGFYNPVNLEALLGRVRDETLEYLESKTEALKRKGVDKISFIAKEGLAADEIIAYGRETPDNLIAMCTHGRSGVRRWVLGSVTESVVRHSGDPVLIVRATG
ncbi:MAG TPA: universal stress protein [Candidatus Binatus sp.]|nr:universal stress protein [Candidatus Binatus sp.]